MNKYTDDEELNKMFEQAFVNEKSLTGDPELDTLFELTGTTFESVEADKLKKRQEWEETRKVILKKTLQDLSETNAHINKLVNAGDAATGIGVSAREIGKFTFNALVDVADAAETYLKEKGIGTGNVINPSYKITDQVAIDAKKDLGSAGKVAYSLYNVVAPLSVGVVTSGGSLAAGITADAAYSFLAQDPADPKLMDLFKGTDFQDLPIVADLMNKPYDTEMDGRIKNTVQSVALGSLIGGGIKLFQAKKASKIVNEIADNAEVAAARADDVINPASVGEPDNFKPTFGKPPTQVKANTVDNVIEAATPVTNKVDEAVPALDDAALAAEEESYKAFEKEAVKVEFFDTGVKTADDGTPRLSRFDVNNNYALNEIIASQADDTRAILYSPMSDTDLKLIAKAHQDDPEITERLLRWRQGDPALSNVEILVLKGHINNRAKDFNAAAAAFNPDDPASVLNFVESLNVYKHLDSVRKGASSANGAALRAWKLGPIMEGTDTKSWLKNLGNKGRANLIKKVIDQAGGIESLKYLSDKIKIISNLPDSNFTYNMGEVEELSKFMRFEEAVTRVAVNGMLSSPATLIKAAVGNTLTAANLVLDDYLIALSPTSKLTIKEANARLTGMMSSLVDALKFGVNAATDPMGYRGATRLDLDRGLAKSFDEKFLESGLTFIEKASTVLSAKDAPIRALIGLDAFTQHIVAQGHIRQKLLSEAMERGLNAADTTEYIAKGLQNVDPKILAEAHQIAAETTLAKELTPELQRVSDRVDELTNFVRFRKVIFPFVRTNLNMIEQFAENSPLAVLSPNFQRIMKTGDQLAKERAYAKVIRGSLQLGSLTYLAATGNIQGVFTEEERVFVGKDLPQETSIKVGDRWVPVKDLPVIGPLTNIAALLSRMSGHLSDEQWSEAVMATTVYIGEVLTPQVLSEGVGGMIQLVTDPEKGMQWLSTIPTRFVPMSGALRDVTQTIDPNSRKQLEKDGSILENLYKTILNRYKAMIPGLSKELPPVISRYGESIKLPDGLPPAAINPFFTTGEANLPHKRAMIKIMDYQKMYGDVLNVPELRLLQAPRSIEAATFGEKLAPLAEQSFRMGELYKLTPMEYAVYQKYFAGFDPMADKPNVRLQEKMADGTVVSSETLLEAETRVLKEYGMLNPDVELTPELYKKVVAQLHKVQIDFKSRADKLIKQYPSVREAMIEQMRKIQQFNDTNGAQ